jgi:hypothetical protein
VSRDTLDTDDVIHQHQLRWVKNKQKQNKTAQFLKEEEEKEERFSSS